MIYHKYVLQSQHFKFHNFVLICDQITFHFHSWVSRHICWFYILFIIKSLAINIVCMYLFVHLASFLLSVYPGNVQGRLCRSIFMFCVKFNLISIVDTLTYNLTYNGYRFLYSFFIIWVLSRISWNVFVNMTIYWLHKVICHFKILWTHLKFLYTYHEPSLFILHLLFHLLILLTF